MTLMIDLLSYARTGRFSCEGRGEFRSRAPTRLNFSSNFGSVCVLETSWSLMSIFLFRFPFKMQENTASNSPVPPIALVIAMKPFCFCFFFVCLWQLVTLSPQHRPLIFWFSLLLCIMKNGQNATIIPPDVYSLSTVQLMAVIVTVFENSLGPLSRSLKNAH